MRRGMTPVRIANLTAKRICHHSKIEGESIHSVIVVLPEKKNARTSDQSYVVMFAASVTRV